MTDSREYPARPICGVGVIVWHDDRVLLIQRGKPPNVGMWGLPGGAIELGESLREAAAREVREECGIEIALGEVVEVVDIVTRDAENRVQYHYVVVDFAAQHTRGELHADSDVTDARWVTRDELLKYDVPNLTRRVILKSFERETKP
ncbi:MAG: NUDIX hydrolase [Chloroflexi bacterium]|nr:NUDIX hydrolase [Chloroflexota bacterium]